MPLYDYSCRTCSGEFEKMQKIADCDVPTTQPCPACGAVEVYKMVAAPRLGDPVHLGITKVPADFSKYVLGRIHANNPGSTIFDRRPRASER